MTAFPADHMIQHQHNVAAWIRIVNSSYRSLILLLPLYCSIKLLVNKRAGHKGLLLASVVYWISQCVTDVIVALNLYTHAAVIMAFSSSLSSLITTVFCLAYFTSRRDLERTFEDSEAIQVIRNEAIVDIEQRTTYIRYLSGLSQVATSKLEPVRARAVNS